MFTNATTQTYTQRDTHANQMARKTLCHSPVAIAAAQDANVCETLLIHVIP